MGRLGDATFKLLRHTQYARNYVLPAHHLEAYASLRRSPHMQAWSFWTWSRMTFEEVWLQDIQEPINSLAKSKTAQQIKRVSRQEKPLACVVISETLFVLCFFVFLKNVQHFMSPWCWNSFLAHSSAFQSRLKQGTVR